MNQQQIPNQTQGESNMQSDHIEETGPTSPKLDGLTVYDQVRVAAEHVLRIHGRIDDTRTWGGGDLFEAVRGEFPDRLGQINKNTFLQYLSNAARDPDSLINCRGRRQGYYISSIAEEFSQSESGTESAADGAGPWNQITAIESTPQRREREARLYPFLEAWLISQGYRAKDVSAGRTLGKWGNPDVAGISVLDSFNGLSLEIATIEAKVSLDNWEQWIFEAVSHRRFANRSYFAFAHPEETINKIPQDMRYYSELYGIGVLAVAIENQAYERLQNGSNVQELDSESGEIIEIYSAPLQFVQPKYQMRFCEFLKASTPGELYQWGRGS